MRCFGWDSCAFRRANNWVVRYLILIIPFRFENVLLLVILLTSPFNFPLEIIGIKYIQNAGAGLYLTMDEVENFIATST
jgi:hypothetical protein